MRDQKPKPGALRRAGCARVTDKEILMSLVDQKRVKSKPELVRALGSSSVEFIAESEPETEGELRAISERVRTMLRAGRRVHVVLLERKKGGVK